MTTHQLPAERQALIAGRNRSVRRVLWVILFANWAVAGLKVALGVMANSTAMKADGLHSFIDGGSNVIGLVAMHFASAPADEDHPYGHQKFETLASLAIGVMVGMGVMELGKMAVDAILHGVQPQVGPLAIGTMVATLAVNVAVTRVEAAQGRKLGSSLLLADAGHTMSDVYVTLAVIASLALSWAGVPRVDGLVSLGVLIIVAHTGLQIIRQAVGVLSDSARVDPVRVREVLAPLKELRGVFDVRSRGMEGTAYVDLKVHVDPALTLGEAHAVADRVERAIAEAFPEVVDVVVHVEPAP